VFSTQLADLLTGRLPARSADVAARALVVLVPAAFVQLLAALAASALAARDSYGTAAAGFALGGITSVVAFAALSGSHGIVSLGLISSAPLTRRGIDPEAAGRHVVYAAWVSLVIVGAAAGVFALVGGRITGVVLGNAYGGGVGRQLGHLVVYLALWMLAWVGFAVT